jgi:hypothetical protein
VGATIIGSLVVAVVSGDEFRPLRSLLVGVVVGTVFWAAWALQYRRAVARGDRAEM